MTFPEQVRLLVENFLGTAVGIFEIFFTQVFALLLGVSETLIRLLGGPF